jgi:hypothetical protein
MSRTGKICVINGLEDAIGHMAAGVWDNDDAGAFVLAYSAKYALGSFADAAAAREAAVRGSAPLVIRGGQGTIGWAAGLSMKIAGLGMLLKYA